MLDHLNSIAPQISFVAKPSYNPQRPFDPCFCAFTRWPFDPCFCAFTRF